MVKTAREKAAVFIILFFLLILGIGCTRHPSIVQKRDALEKLSHELDYFFSDPSFANAFWGVAIKSIDTGEILYLHNENKGFMPASNMKLFTTASSLLKLGENYRFQTNLYVNGTIDDSGVLQGDLIIRGVGDPTISGRFHDGNATQVFEDWADSLKQKGIRAISGRIIGDDNYFTDEIMGAGWSWDYQSDYYAAQISALSFNDNCEEIIFSPGDSVGAPTTFRLVPQTDYVTVINKVVTADKVKGTDIIYNRERGRNIITCSGSLYIEDKNKMDWFSVENPTLFAATIFKETLQKKGIDVKGEAYDIDDVIDYRYNSRTEDIVARYISPPLSEIVLTINKVSQNLYAELLLRVLGKEFGGEGSAVKGAEIEKELFAKMGINPDYLVIADGSGLSRVDLVTPLSVVKLLTFMYRQPVGESYVDTLPIAGVDGTIRKRMKGTAAEGNVRAKTGYIGGVRALSGYVTTKDDEHLAFSMICNNYTVPTALANHVQDTVCERLANFSRNDH